MTIHRAPGPIVHLVQFKYGHTNAVATTVRKSCLNALIYFV